MFPAFPRLSHLFVLVLFSLAAIWSIRDFLDIAMIVGHNWDGPFSGLSISYESRLRDLFSSWDEQNNLGINNVSSFSTKIWWGLNSLLGIALDGQFMTQLRMIMDMALGGFGVYYYLFIVLRSSDKTRSAPYFAAWCGGFYLMFAPVLTGHFIGGAFSQLDSMLFTLPLLIVLEKGRQGLLSPRAVAILSWLLYLLIEVSIHSILFGSMFVTLYIVFLYSWTPREKATFLAIFFSILLLIFAHWVLPLSTALMYENVSKRLAENIGYENLIVNVPDLTDAWFGNGYIRPFYNYIIGSTLYPYWKAFSLLFFTGLIGFLLWESRKFQRNRNVFMVWTSIFLVFLVFSTGFKAPLGHVVEFLYRNFYPMSIFRSPQWLLMPMTMALAVLLGMSIDRLEKRGLRWWGRGFIMLGLLFILSPSYWYGDFGTDLLYKRAKRAFNWYKADHLDGYRIPDDYQAALKKLHADTDGDYRVLLLPMSGSPYFHEASYQREGSGIDPLIIYRAPKPFIFTDIGADYDSRTIATTVERMIYKERDTRFVSLLPILNAPYILFKKDHSPNISNYRLEWDRYQTYTWMKEHQSEIGTPIIDGESTLFMRVKNADRFSHIYVPDRVLVADWTIKADSKGRWMSQELPPEYINIWVNFLEQGGQPVVLKPKPTTKQWEPAFSGAPPTIEAHKIDPSHYTVRLKGLRENALVVLSEAFHPGWRIFFKERSLWDELTNPKKLFLPDIYHEQANVYANAWLLDVDYLRSIQKEGILQMVQDADGSYTVDLWIDFSLQRFVTIGFLISLIAMVVGVFFPLFRQPRSRLLTENRV